MNELADLIFDLLSIAGVICLVFIVLGYISDDLERRNL